MADGWTICIRKLQTVRKGIACMLFLLCVFAGHAQQLVPGLTGGDFWLTFLRNGIPGTCYLVIASEYDCIAYIENPRRGLNYTVNVSAGQELRYPVPDDQSQLSSGCTMADDGWHVTTTAPAIVYASNYTTWSHDMTSIIPTTNLRCDYQTQSCNGNASDHEVSVVAPYDNTLVQFLFSGDAVLSGTYEADYHAGDTLDTVLMRGQVCHLKTVNLQDPWYYFCHQNSFSGMRVHSSRPVAVYQGNTCTFLPQMYAACDHLYEQCIPVDCWGRNFVVMPTTDRVRYDWDTTFGVAFLGGDMVQVMAREDNCVVSIDGQPADTLNAGQTYTFYMANHPPDSLLVGQMYADLDFYQSDALSITASSPVSVCFYISSMGFGGYPGDPAMVIVPALEQGISRTVATAFATPTLENHYVNIVATDSTLMTIDGESIASYFQPLQSGYCYARLAVDSGAHVIDADTGRFLATFYGLGSWESYAYIAGMAVRSTDYEVRADSHALCQGDTLTVIVRVASVHDINWIVDGLQVATHADTLQYAFDTGGLHRIAVVIKPWGDTVWEFINVHPTFTLDEKDTICYGARREWRGMMLTDSGTYVDPKVTFFGCDSTATIHMSVIDCGYEYATLEADRKVICIGDSVILTAGGAQRVNWHAEPHDESLGSLRGQYTIVVHPKVTTTYSLLDDDSNVVAAVTVEVGHNPVPRAFFSPEELNMEYPNLVLTDNSEGCSNTRWIFDDNTVLNGKHVIRQYQYLETDSVTVTMVSCNRYGCCADTTIIVPMCIRSIWFPNVFTPNGETNTTFGCHTSFEFVSYELTIYNRQGLEVWSTSNANERWDGSRNGSPCPQTAYTYVLFYKSKNNPSRLQKMVGTVTLIR